MQQWLRVGQVVRPQGVRGELKVLPLTDDPERFHKLDSVRTEDGQEYMVRAARLDPKKEFVYLTLSGITDRNRAEAFRDAYLLVDRAHAVPLQENCYFICDLEGCHVLDMEGQERGVLTQVIQNAAQDIYVVTGKREWMVPAVSAFVKKVDIAAGTVIMDFNCLEEEEV